MRFFMGLAIVAIGSVLLAPIALAAEPAWAVVSTEVDETLDGTGYMDRQMLSLYPPDFKWSGSLSDVFFDPGSVFGVETGLDAFDIHNDGRGDCYYFSTEVDFEYGGVAYQDEDLLYYNPALGTVGQAWDVKDTLNDDYGLDAACWLYEPHDEQWMLAFSTEVGGSFDDESGASIEFTDGDILVTDGLDIIGMLSLEEYIGRNVGLDALHVVIEEEEFGPTAGPVEVLQVLFSTEVDGVLMTGENDIGDEVNRIIPFKDQDILSMSFLLDDGPGPLLGAELAWEGNEGFGKDVGLDALYVEIPEPTTLLLAGLGLGALIVRMRKK